MRVASNLLKYDACLIFNPPILLLLLKKIRVQFSITERFVRQLKQIFVTTLMQFSGLDLRINLKLE